MVEDDQAGPARSATEPIAVYELDGRGTQVTKLGQAIPVAPNAVVLAFRGGGDLPERLGVSVPARMVANGGDDHLQADTRFLFPVERVHNWVTTEDSAVAYALDQLQTVTWAAPSPGSSTEVRSDSNDRRHAVALEFSGGTLNPPKSSDDGLSGRSFWCLLFPQLRICRQYD